MCNENFTIVTIMFDYVRVSHARAQMSNGFLHNIFTVTLCCQWLNFGVKGGTRAQLHPQETSEEEEEEEAKVVLFCANGQQTENK